MRTCPVCKKPNDRDQRAIYCSLRCARRARYLRHLEALKASARAYKTVNRDKVLAGQAVYRERMRETSRRRDRERRAQARLAAQRLRPRCVVCSDPIQYGKSGVRLLSRTCGKRGCRAKAYRWFGPMKAA